MERKIYTSEEMDEKLDSLPENIQKIIYGPEIDIAVQKIGQKYQLHIDEMGLLHAEIVDVMIGKTESEDFVPYLIETLEIDREKAASIAEEVNTLLLTHIRDAMRYGGDIAANNMTAPTNTPPQAVSPTPEYRAADVVLSQKTLAVPNLTNSTAPEHQIINQPIPTLLPPPPAQVSYKPSIDPSPKVESTPQPRMGSPKEPEIPPAPPTRNYSTDPYHEPI